MKKYVHEIKRVKKILGKSEKSIQKEELAMSKRSKKDIKSSRKIFKGESISLENTFPMRPAEKGISIDNLEDIIGKRVNCDIETNTFIQYSQII